LDLVSSKLKKRLEELIGDFITPLSKLGITPNHITILGVLVSIFSAYFFATWKININRLIIAATLLLLSGFLDAIDGILARKTGQVSRFGGFFDSVSDRYSDAIELSGIIIGGLCNPIIGLAALIGSMMVSYARARAEAEDVIMAGVGLAERAERMVFLALCSFIAFYWLDALNWGVLVLAVLAHTTVIQRSLYFKKEISKV
jgi:archaetidylinositol phosphate synthase